MKNKLIQKIKVVVVNNKNKTMLLDWWRHTINLELSETRNNGISNRECAKILKMIGCKREVIKHEIFYSYIN